MNIVNISKQRYTAKRYDKNKLVSYQDLEKLLTVLRNSPSSVNSQPWHFIVVNNATSQDKILPAILEFNHARITDSSYTIIFCIKSTLSNDYLKHILDTEIKDGRFTKPEIAQSMDKDRRYFIGLNSATDEQLHSWESHQLYLALGQFMFAAASIGIDSTPIEGFDAPKMDELLGLKEKGLKSIVVASIGYHADNDSNAKRPKSRLPKEEIFTFI
ncbi:oxygen-insensitive NAD(P)H nitroreductase [Commensalibacter nepenthis]|uniref:Oxygen-insensitive NAD(P)H nitroreductase n=1 Tax=Commensalibacter nepenthis TaxID=3043872 RepID=A0ABT6Q538_9PROT|nr:oxygen-insensitive NAD(P)H nitroreductase [Commensalibacter sp. TBRC 10068]MDI2111991.1 oxygen-insensitive NAD(P)H nitroreductase [Commensalibacter sp. TBRC 10068]